MVTLPLALFAAAVAVAGHAGFQLTVTALAYPVLVRTPADAWASAHERHSRWITPLVVAAYGALVVSGAWVATEGPWSAALALALTAAGGAVVVTALLAAPLHGRLGRVGADPALLRRLLVVDRVRAVLAVVALLSVAVALVRAGSS